MARAPKKSGWTPHEGDQVWVLAKVVRLGASEDGRTLEDITVIMPNGHRETLTFSEEDIRPVEAG